MIDHVLREWTPETIQKVIAGKDPYLAPKQFSGWGAEQKNVWRTDAVERLARAMGYDPEELTSEKRNHDVVMGRHAAMVWMVRCTHHSLSSVGRHFNRDHATVRLAVIKHDKRLKTDEYYLQLWNRLLSAAL